MTLNKLNGLSENVTPKKSSVLLVIFGTVVSSLAVGITAVSLPFLFPFFRKICLPYVPATKTQVDNVLKALKGKSGNVIDLGSGDGRIVIAAAQNGFQSTGVELNPWLVAYSKVSAYRLGVFNKTKFIKCNLWKFNIQPYNIAIVFGVETMMDELENKFKKELKMNSYVVACRFPLISLKPIQVIGSGIDRVWIYKVN